LALPNKTTVGARSGAVPVDGGLPTPLYHQIYTILRDDIVSGRYPAGTILPSEFELTRDYGVSRVTAKRALNDLAAEGLVSRERGRGTVVRYEAAVPPLRSSVEGLLENLLAMGLATEVRLLEFDYVPATTEVARALGVEAGATVQRAVRVRSLEGEPFSHLTTHVPAAIGRSFSREDLASEPLLRLLERCGVVVSSARQTITATLADARIAALLKVQIGAPLLAISRVVFDQGGQAVEYITGLYRPERYQYQMTLNRIEGADHKLWSPAA
jgi:GntR family transcriptional regulator